eukprot:COSAG05_NODE_4298_length_1575_cov_36.036585_1_plen_73_part_00
MYIIYVPRIGPFTVGGGGGAIFVVLNYIFHINLRLCKEMKITHLLLSPYLTPLRLQTIERRHGQEGGVIPEA